MSITAWIEQYVPGGTRIEARPAARRRLHHRVRRRVLRSELAQHALPARLRRPGSVPDVREVEREAPCPRRQRSPRRRDGRAARRPDRNGDRARRRSRARVGRQLHADLPGRIGHERRWSADHVVLALPFSLLRSVDCVAGGLQHRSRRRRSESSGMAANSKLHLQFSDAASGVDLGCDGETYSDSWLPEHMGGFARPGRASRASSSTTPAGAIGSELRRGHAERSRAKSVPGPARARVARAISAKWNGTGDARLLGRKPVDERLLLVLEGRPVHALRGGRGRGARATAISQASTRRSIPGIPERGPSKPASGAPRRSSAT